MFELDFADVKPSVLSFMTTGIMAVVFIVLLKFLVNEFKNPITDIFRDVANAV